jgi:hypothetical protein
MYAKVGGSPRYMERASTRGFLGETINNTRFHLPVRANGIGFAARLLRVISDEDHQRESAAHVRFAPKADKQR